MDQYEEKEVIGHGSFGKVVKIVRKQDGRELVWKELDYSEMKEKEKQQLVSEVNNLRELRHPNIVRYYDRIIEKQQQKIYIVMEYCAGGDLAQFLKRCKQNNELIPEENIWKILMQVIQAIYEIHRRKEGKIIHRDIKPANIFLDSKNNVKLGDFGLSKKLSEESQYAYTNVGTPYYMSPEQLNENKYNEKSDIWSIGCLLYELCSLSPPFNASNHLALAMKIKTGKFERIPKQYSDEMMRVIVWCLHRNQEQRPSVDDLQNIPQVSYRLREKRYRDNQNIIVQRETEVKQRQNEIEKIQAEIEKFQKLVEIQKDSIEKKEKIVLEKQKEIENQNKISENSTPNSIQTLKINQNNNNYLIKKNYNQQETVKITSQINCQNQTENQNLFTQEKKFFQENSRPNSYNNLLLTANANNNYLNNSSLQNQNNNSNSSFLQENNSFFSNIHNNSIIINNNILSSKNASNTQRSLSRENSYKLNISKENTPFVTNQKNLPPNNNTKNYPNQFPKYQSPLYNSNEEQQSYNSSNFSKDYNHNLKENNSYVSNISTKASLNKNY